MKDRNDDQGSPNLVGENLRQEVFDAVELECGGGASVSQCGNSFDATTIPTPQVHDDAKSEQHLFGENTPVLNVRKGR